MKAIYSIILMCFLVIVFTNARAEKVSRDVRKYQAELKLTPQQMQQLDAIYNNTQAKAKLNASSPTNGEAKLQQKRALMKAQRQEVRRVLTPQQKLAYAKMNGIQPKKGKKK